MKVVSDLILLIITVFFISRPLPEELIKYAREDTHYLLYVYDCMRNELIERGNNQTNLLEAVYSRSKQVAAKVTPLATTCMSERLTMFQENF